MKLLTLFLLSLGEFLMIYAEEMGAKSYHATGQFFHVLLNAFPIIIISAITLVCAYILGFKYAHNIWVLSAVSFGTILVVEPLFNYFYIGDLPTLGAGAGFILGVLGILATLFL